MEANHYSKIADEMEASPLYQKALEAKNFDLGNEQFVELLDKILEGATGILVASVMNDEPERFATALFATLSLVYRLGRLAEADD